MAKVARVWNGSAWVEILSAPTPVVFYQNEAPTTASDGDIWIDANASTADAGVSIIDSVSSTSATSAASANSVKTAYDLANAAVPGDSATTKKVILSNTATDKSQLQITSTTAGAGMTIGGDTNLYRAAANTLQTDDNLIIASASSTQEQIQLSSTTAGAGIKIGSDVSLYRQSSDLWKTDANLIADNLFTNLSSTATSAGTTTLTLASFGKQVFTGSSNQTVVLPVASTLVVGWSCTIINNSTGTLTIQSSGGNTVGTVPAGAVADATCILASGTGTASWDFHRVLAYPELIASSTLGVSSQTFTVSNIPSTYKTLLVYGYFLKSSTTTAADLQVIINGLTTATYGSKVFGATQTATTMTVVAATTGQTSWTPASTNSALQSSAISGSAFIRLEIPGYSQTSGYKHALWSVHIGGTTTTMAGGFFIGAGQSSTTAAISSIALRSASATNVINAGAIMEVYGMQ